MKKLIISIYIIFCVGCTLSEKKESYEYQPPNNPYPNIFTTVETQLSSPKLTVDVRASSLELSCSMRNDSPLYWCYLDGELIKTDKTRSYKVETFYHVVVDKAGVSKSKNMVERMRKNGDPVTLLVNMHVYIGGASRNFQAQLVGLYNNKECMNLFEDYSTCPEASKVIHLW